MNDKKSMDVNEIKGIDFNDREHPLMDQCRLLPKYKSHKEVWAIKIKEIVKDVDLANKENRETDGSAIITPEEGGYSPFSVDFRYLKKHNPEVGGYYVIYKDGYASWSPASAFEEGYTKV